MSSDRDGTSPPLWMHDARIRRMIADAVRRRRAKRKRELADFEIAVRNAEDAGQAKAGRT